MLCMYLQLLFCLAHGSYEISNPKFDYKNVQSQLQFSR